MPVAVRLLGLARAFPSGDVCVLSGVTGRAVGGAGCRRVSAAAATAPAAPGAQYLATRYTMPAPAAVAGWAPDDRPG